MSDTELLIKTLLHQARLHNKHGSSGLGLLFTNAAQEIGKLQEENAELKKQVKRNDLSENWPVFLSWYGDYCGIGLSDYAWKAMHHSREDMRYAYQAGYEAALPTPPEGE